MAKETQLKKKIAKADIPLQCGMRNYFCSIRADLYIPVLLSVYLYNQ